MPREGKKKGEDEATTTTLDTTSAFLEDWVAQNSEYKLPWIAHHDEDHDEGFMSTWFGKHPSEETLETIFELITTVFALVVMAAIYVAATVKWD
jgi:hypothetical protein